MSYTIEYNRQFIKTKNGYIPCWLAGDNNVTEGWGKNERRVRDWGVFMNWLDVTEEYMLEQIKSLYNDYDQHWKKGSTWVTNEGLLRWVKNGCKSAGTVEEILEVNPKLRNIDCHIIFYDNGDNRCELFKSTISTSRGLEEWLNKIKDFKNSLAYEGCKGFYPVVDFYIEDLKHPVKVADIPKLDTDEFLIKYKTMYLVSINKGCSNWTKDVREATVYTYGDYLKLKEEYLGTHNGSYLVQAKLIKAEKKEQTLFVIKFVDGVYAGKYLGNKRQGNIGLAYDAKGAKQYTTRKAAVNALDNYKYGFSKYGNLEIEEYN